MNLSRLFELQRQLDERIVKEHGLEGQDLLPKKILALQVELGELANCWRGFKFWSKDQQPRTYSHGTNPLLEEYVDCLHFFLSIGNEHGLTEFGEWINETDLTDVFSSCISIIGGLDRRFQRDELKEIWSTATSLFINIGLHLGFIWEQIEAAYLEKNEVNHARQNNGY